MTTRSISKRCRRLVAGLVAGMVAGGWVCQAAEGPPAKATIVFLAGGPSHGPGTHEHQAGCALLARLLAGAVPGVTTTVCRGWPADPAVLEPAAAVVVFGDGEGAHLLLPHLAELDRLLRRGVGLACLHYAVAVPKGDAGNRFLDWIGGYYETSWSVNPVWEADFRTFPVHPVARGVKPFRIRDEWYYHMRFRDDPAGLVPVLSAVPPDSTRQGPDGPHSGNPTVRARLGQAETVAWAFERPGGGRGFGYTGGHWHANWADDNLRRLVLNALVWVAGLDVPETGVDSPTPTPVELAVGPDRGAAGDK